MFSIMKLIFGSPSVFVIYIHDKPQERIPSSCSFVIMKDGLSHVPGNTTVPFEKEQGSGTAR